MVVRAEAVAYGEPAMRLLDERVRKAKGGEPLAPVTVVVASNAVAVAARRALAAQPGGVANVSFLTLHRLAERLGAPALAGAGRRPVSAPVLGAAVRAVLADAPGVFAPVADHPATEEALVAAHRELAAARDSALDDVAACSERAADVVRISRTVRADLAPRWYDEQDLLTSAAAGVRSGTVPPVGPVVLHLLQDTSAAGADLLRALRDAEVVEALVGVTGVPEADARVVHAVRRAGLELPTEHGVHPAGASRIVSASDPDDEVRAAVRQVTAWAHEGADLGRVALLHGTADPYRRLLHQHLGAAGIPWHGAGLRPVADLLAGRTLRALLALGDRGYRRSDVLAVLTGAPVLDGDGRVPGRAWERLSRRAGVVGGADWDGRLATLAAEDRRLADLAEADELDRKAAGLRREADRADALAAFVRDLRRDLDAGAVRAAGGSWPALVDWAKGLLETYLGDDARRRRWPEAERTGAEQVEAALDRLAGLGEVEARAAPTVEVFRRALEGELASMLPRHGRIGEGVLVGPVAAATGLALDHVIVLGMAEGTFPPRRLEDSLLPDAEREAAGGELPLRTARVHDDHRALLAAMASAPSVVLCYPRGDLRRPGERPASRWLLAEAARLAGEPALRTEELAGHAGAPWLDVVPSFAAGLARVATPTSAQELRLAVVARGAGDHPALVDPGLDRALEAVDSRRSDRFTRFDGNLTALADTLGLPERLSATRLQTWAACPHAYLVQYVLGVEPVEEPGRRLEIDPLDRGSLVHEVLDRFVGDAVATGHPLDGWGEADGERMRAIAEEVFARYEAEGRTGRRILWRRDRAQLLADLERFVRDDGARLAQGARPVATEHGFTDLEVALPGRRAFRVRGAIDRIDRDPDGSLVVLDYKTGGTRAYDRLSEADPHQRGTMLQLYLYAQAARADFPLGVADDPAAPVRASYWFTSLKGDFKLKGYELTPEVEAEIEAALDLVVEGIEGGVFPARPADEPAFAWVDCWYCTPDGLSDTERRRDWGRKRLDPALAGFLALAEPEATDGG